MNRRLPLILAGGLFAGVLALYLATTASGIVPGDPTEYTFVAHVLGIAHPPGYALMTLLTKLWQVLIPLGTVAQRSHWLASLAGAVTATAAFGTVWQIISHWPGSRNGELAGRAVAALLGGLSVAAAADHWQHSIHINSHIVTVTLNALAVFLLVRWALTDRNGWLYAFCWVAGLGPTHHPLTVFAFPAYGLLILLMRPALLRPLSGRWWRRCFASLSMTKPGRAGMTGWRTPLTMLLFALLGLAVWLYYPIRSPMRPVFGPDDMNTADGFLNVVLARGLRVNLFHFGLAEQGQRLLVFWTLLRQQFALPVIGLAAAGLAWLAARERRLGAFLSLLLLIQVAFIINTVQDVMAYLLTPFMLVGTLAGVGAWGLIEFIGERPRARQTAKSVTGLTTALLALALLAWPLLALIQNGARISLRGYRAGDEYVAAVFERFEGSSEGAVLLNDWEHITPLWYSRWVDGRWPDPADVTPSMVSTARPWLQRVFDHLPAGPVYLSGYRREVVDAGFRLRPDGPFYRVVEPGDQSLPAGFRPVSPLPDQSAGQGSAPAVELLGYRLARAELPAGGLVQLDLAMRAPVTPTAYLVPYAQVGEVRYSFTTDSHLLTPLWRPGEVIVERFEWALPPDLPAGRYPLRVGLANLSAGTETEAVLLEELVVSADPAAPSPAVLDRLLANFGQRVGVDRVTVRGPGERRSAVWQEPLVLRPGQSVEVTIQWRCLAPVEESYTVFVHLMDGANRIWDQQDYTPLGGSYPTHLWIPKWLPGQTALDPYRLTMPAGAPPGDYFLEIGLYGMTTRQRIYQYDRAGNLVGDRLVLGPLRVP